MSSWPSAGVDRLEEKAFSFERSMEKDVDQCRRGGTGTFDTASPHMKQVVQLQRGTEKCLALEHLVEINSGKERV